MNIESAKKYNGKHATDLQPDTAGFAQLVEAYQKGAGLIADGMFGPGTRAALLGPAPAPAGPLIELVDFVPTTWAQARARWQSFIKLPIRYKLSAGGRDPRADDPRSEVDGVNGLDCSGAHAAARRFARKQKNFRYYGGWVNTDSMIADARGKQDLYEPLDRPVPGAVLVFCGIDIDNDGKRNRVGHVADVDEIAATFDPKHPNFLYVTIFDCAGSNSELPGSDSDVARHPAGYFNGKDKFTYKGKTYQDDEWKTQILWCRAQGRPA